MRSSRDTNPKTVLRASLQRDNQTPAEARLWERIRGNALGVRFFRQEPTFGYIPDFVSPEAMLIVEVDGRHHNRGSDGRRDRNLTHRGYRILRFQNDEVFLNLERVLSIVTAEVAKRLL
jgi:very-short-patch-repair endonuclease